EVKASAFSFLHALVNQPTIKQGWIGLASNSSACLSIPVIDIFAGPGGLSEGFSAFKPADNEHPFRVKLSIEKEPLAYQTLRLRAFFRQFSEGQIPSEYYAFLRDTTTPLDKRLRKLFNSHPQAAARAKEEARLAELGVKRPLAVRQWIDRALGDSDLWVLIGGPPCQAYSLVGRSRNKGIEDYVAEDDRRQYLYVEYLQVLADHRPAVFIMENVKGLLSATLDNQRIFERICDDLQDPVKALRREQRTVRRKHRTQPAPPHRYRLFPLAEYSGVTKNYSLFPDDERTVQQTDLSRFVVRMEQHGIPQARHRVVILGVREDLSSITPGTLRLTAPVGVKQVLTGLPRLRSGLSGETDSRDAWIARLREMSADCLFQAAREKDGEQLFQLLTDSLTQMEQEELGRGDEFVTCTPTVNYRPDWFLDPQMAGVSNHRTRLHIPADLHRYFFASCFAATHQRSPKLHDFPTALLPAHASVDAALSGSHYFADRFRVQVADKPSATVTSHLAKDGHYCIHYDPVQFGSRSRMSH
ncbi:MAG: DNA cytosine methyltransferase, partial [Blastocatellia bacterium]